MSKKILSVFVFILICEFLYFIEYKNMELTFLLGLAIFWVSLDILGSLSTNEFYKDGYFKEEYHTYSNYNYGTYTPNKTTKKENQRNYVTKSRDELEIDLIKAIKPNKHIVIFSKDEKKQQLVTEKKNKYCELIENPQESYKLKIDKNVPTTVIPKKEENKPIALLPPSSEKNETDKMLPSFAKSLILIDNVDTLTDIQKNVYDSIINYLKNQKLNVFNIRELLKNIFYIDIVEFSTKNVSDVVIYVYDYNLFNIHNIKFDNIGQNIKEKCGNIQNVMFQKIVYKNILNYYDSFSKL